MTLRGLTPFERSAHNTGTVTGELLSRDVVPPAILFLDSGYAQAVGLSVFGKTGPYADGAGLHIDFVTGKPSSDLPKRIARPWIKAVRKLLGPQ